MMLDKFLKGELDMRERLAEIRWALVWLVTAVASIGCLVLYSAANGNFDPWADRQMTRFCIGLILMLAIALVDIRVWARLSYLVYFIGVVLLVAVELFGETSQGATRWLHLGVIRVQPSEIMKIGLVLALARYFHSLKSEYNFGLKQLLIPALMIVVPVGLILVQPDLGTAGLILLTSIGVLVAAGISMRIFMVCGGLGIAGLPILWHFLRDYQRNRVLTFLDPERDPLGTGYHIIQSKIALGSGGFFGKGFMKGSQSQLNFLPEKQTDFIFTMFGEEFGLVGGLVLLGLYSLILFYGYAISMRVRSQFGRLVSIGVMTTFFLYFFINIAMVSGMFPVVGVPLPFMSYGGTALISLMIGFGLLMNAWVHRDTILSKMVD